MKVHWKTLVWTGVVYVGGVFILYIGLLVLVELGLFSIADETIILLTAAVVTIGLGVFYGIRFRRTLVSEFTKEKKIYLLLLKAIICAAAIMGISLLSELLLSNLFDGAALKNEDTVNLLIGSFPILSLIMSVIAAPITEELLFRYILQNWLRRICGKYGKVVSVVVIGLLFGFLHSGFTPAIIVYGAIGFVMGLCYLFTDNIAVMILAHMLNNLAGYFL